MSAEVADVAETTTPETTEPDGVNVGLVATITIVGALLVVAIAAALTALVRSESSAFGIETGSYANLGAVKRLKAEQHAKLEAPIAWADKGKGLAQLPIDRAMQLVETDIQRDPYLATVAPAASEAPAGSAAPAGTAASGSSNTFPGSSPPAGVEMTNPHDTAGPEKAAGDKGKNGGKHPATGASVGDAHGAPVTPAAAPAPPK